MREIAMLKEVKRGILNFQRQPCCSAVTPHLGCTLESPADLLKLPAPKSYPRPTKIESVEVGAGTIIF